MLRDVFYFGSKPNVHPRERPATDINHARSLCTTDHFWVVNEYCDYTDFDWDFDFEFLSDNDVWAEEHNNVWPSIYQKDSGTWLCTKEEGKLIIYRNDVDPVKRKNIKTDNWNLLDKIDESKFDFKWHPDPTEPPYIYRWGNKFYPVELNGSLEYVVPGATQIKYMASVVELLPDYERWEIPENIDKNSFDFSWRPDPREPALIYDFGTQWQKTGGPRYVCEGATDIKYIEGMNAKILPNKDNWHIVENDIVDTVYVDYSWHPDANDPPYIYVFGNQYYDAQTMPTIEYHAPGATQKKYVSDNIATIKSKRDNWIIPNNIAYDDKFDFNWIPDPNDPPYIYQFGTQHQKTGGIQYVVPNATEVKYMDVKVTALPTTENWIIVEGFDVKDFDYSWHPDATEEPYIYVFGNNLYPAGECPTVEYHMKGATQRKYISVVVATLGPNKKNWFIPDNIDVTDFDFSWIPNPTEPPFIYHFGTQWQKTGGPRYIVKNSSQTKYMDVKAKALPTKEYWYVEEGFKIKEFDYSWHPDVDERFIYVFGNNLYPAEECPTVKYIMPGATEIKYINDVVAILDKNTEKWFIPDNIDVTDFDFSWIPRPKDPPYIYQFGTQWQKTGGPRYVVSDATEIKYVNEYKAIALPTTQNWHINEDMKVQSFDYSWHPDDTEEPYIYVFGNQYYSAEIMPTIEYRMLGATEIKYIHDNVAKITNSRDNWVIPDNISADDFDYNWIPNPNDPPYIYEFSTQWQKTGGPKYVMRNATEYKYMTTDKVKVLPTKNNWKIIEGFKIKEFDYSWHPDTTEQPYIYVFGNQWHNAEKQSTIEYHVHGATEYKYISDIVATLGQNYTNWEIPKNIDIRTFDFSWIPDPNSPPYIYEFATEWNNRGGPKYIVPNAIEYKYVEDIKAKLLPSKDNWIIPENISVDEFDFSWIPHPEAPPYIYEFATQWNNRGGPKYVVPGATDYKYIEDIKAKLLPNKDNWIIPAGINIDDFDFSWAPHPEAPLYIYQFGTLQDDNDGPIYKPTNNNGEIVKLSRVYKSKEQSILITKYYIKTTLEDLVKEHSTEVFWAMRENIDYGNFDFDWRPEVINVAWESDYVHVFGSPEAEITQTYFVNAKSYLKGKQDFKYIEADKKADAEYLATLFKQSDMFFVDRGNIESKERYEVLKSRYPGIQKTRFLNTWVDTISRCINRANTELCWILNSELDYSKFDFNYYPNPWQMKMVHVFGTQWNQWGTTYIVNRETFSEDTKYIKIIEHLSNINIVKDRRANATNNIHDIWLIDHGNDLTQVKETLERKSCGKSINIIPYDNSYLQTFKNLVKKIPDKKEDYIWLCSSICDYSTFDFSYTVDPFSRDNLHVFASDQQKFGDTFFVDVNKTKEVIESIEKLQAYPKANYNNTLRAKRLAAPVINIENDTFAGVINVEYDFPYAVFQTEHVDVVDQEPISLWSDDMKTITVTSTGATRIIVPKEAKNIVKNELYDYPYIKTASKLGSSKPMDIVFLSNGEQCADENYKHLLAVTKHTKNRVVRVDGVDGRAAAYHAAVEASNTPWAFTVFAKLKVNSKFDWGWQPDRMQIPKHYIFHAKNPVNGLEYGHQGMIAYNKKLTLANQGKGLDFTLDDPHETVKLLSGIAVFNTDPYSTWRTAFREVIKLQSDYSDIASERLNIWTTVAEGEFAEYCLQGAKDAVEFYDSVMGDIDELKKSYEWEWLKEFYRKKYR